MDEPANINNINRATIRGVVEEHWRLLLSLLSPDIPRQKMEEASDQFDSKIRSAAALMPHDQAQAYMRIVDEEYDIIVEEMNRNPDALLRRLGPLRGIMKETASALTDNLSIDRTAIHNRVEDYWRSFLTFTSSNPKMASESTRRFNELIEATASLMPADQVQEYLQAVEGEREVLFQEYRRNPDAQKHRLGVGTNQAPQHVAYHQEGMGEMVVRTAVRATVWQAIWSLFRR